METQQATYETKYETNVKFRTTGISGVRAAFFIKISVRTVQ